MTNAAADAEVRPLHARRQQRRRHGQRSTTSRSTGNRAMRAPPPENAPPVIGDVTADPTIGFAPLQVNFTAARDRRRRRRPDLQLGLRGRRHGGLDASRTRRTPTRRRATKTAWSRCPTARPRATKSVTVQVLEPDDAGARFRVLVFSKTAGFRHSSIDEGHAAIEQLGAENNFQVDHTEDATAFRDAILANYDAVVWLSTTGRRAQRRPSRPRSSATSGPGAATRASTPRPTRSTTGSGTASWSAPTS